MEESDPQVVLKKYGINEITNVYPKIYELVFGEFTVNGNCPSEVYLGFENDKVVGFAAGYIQSPNTWYLQRAGFTMDEQRRAINLKRYLAALEVIHETWQFITTLVKNTDFRALKMDLATGWVINGCRIDSAKDFWVELTHQKRTAIER